ncbi:GTP-dependent dephospho-CoA kinase family protein [Halorussus halophilus]|uniref:GTP-dependent dephospho-CoA kinase family protein n=1 Tax=Halorussus halophilus TaxID=2650975 RepID=UPI0037423205
MTRDDGDVPPNANDSAHPDDSPDADADVLVRLPRDLRAELKEPMGPIFTDSERLLSAVEGPLITVGDVVTSHLEQAGRTPDVAVVDGLTKREEVGGEVAEVVAALIENTNCVEVENPAATLTREMVVALRDALRSGEPTTIVVDGEEDLVALPAIVAAPIGASVVYGQPNEGMVHAEVTAKLKEEMRELLGKMDGDATELLAVFED